MKKPTRSGAGKGALDLMPSLPAWASLPLGLIRKVEQRSRKDGKFRIVPVLPMDQMLTAVQRTEIEAQVATIESLLDQTPESHHQYEGKTLLLITKLLLAFPSAQQSEVVFEAIGESYQIALHDVPTWAVALAVSSWYRRECGNNAKGNAYDYTWRPCPPDLRAIALTAAAPVSQRLAVLSDLLAAEPLAEHDEEHCRRMSEKLSALARQLRSF